MASKKRPETPVGTGGAGERELVVMVRPGAGLRMRGGMPEAAAASAATGLVTRIAKEAVTLRPLFGASPERLAVDAATRRVAAPLPDLSGFYRVDADDARLDAIAEALLAEDAVEAAYVKPPSELPMLNDMAPQAEDAPPVTPDFNARQIYLDAPPAGVNARAVWALLGGSGAGIRIIDIEGAWRFTHEDLLLNQGGVIGGHGRDCSGSPSTTRERLAGQRRRPAARPPFGRAGAPRSALRSARRRCVMILLCGLPSGPTRLRRSWRTDV